MHGRNVWQQDVQVRALGTETRAELAEHRGRSLAFPPATTNTLATKQPTNQPTYHGVEGVHVGLQLLWGCVVFLRALTQHVPHALGIRVTVVQQAPGLTAVTAAPVSVRDCEGRSVVWKSAAGPRPHSCNTLTPFGACS